MNPDFVLNWEEQHHRFVAIVGPTEAIDPYKFKITKWVRTNTMKTHSTIPTGDVTQTLLEDKMRGYLLLLLFLANLC